jgi:hypothetical protein
MAAWEGVARAGFTGRPGFSKPRLDFDLRGACLSEKESRLSIQPRRKEPGTVKPTILVLTVLAALLVAGCKTPAKHVKDLRLGMTPEEVEDVMGKPYTIRAAKVFEDGQTQSIWEYLARFAINPKDYWLYFENGKLVQWGEPGDFAGKVGLVPVEEYKAVKDAR